jgi:hypothetical protein
MSCQPPVIPTVRTQNNPLIKKLLLFVVTTRRAVTTLFLTAKPRVKVSPVKKPVMRELCFNNRGALSPDTSSHGFYAGVFIGSFSSLVFAVCSCFFIFCFRALSLSFLPLSPTVDLLLRSALLTNRIPSLHEAKLKLSRFGHLGQFPRRVPDDIDRNVRYAANTPRLSLHFCRQ